MMKDKPNLLHKKRMRHKKFGGNTNQNNALQIMNQDQKKKPHLNHDKSNRGISKQNDGKQNRFIRKYQNKNQAL